jgi:hypothetical protein
MLSIPISNFRNLSDGVEFNFEGTGNSVATGDTLLAYGTQGADTYVGSAENDVVIAEGAPTPSIPVPETTPYSAGPPASWTTAMVTLPSTRQLR